MVFSLNTAWRDWEISMRYWKVWDYERLRYCESTVHNYCFFLIEHTIVSKLKSDIFFLTHFIVFLYETFTILLRLFDNPMAKMVKDMTRERYSIFITSLNCYDCYRSIIWLQDAKIVEILQISFCKCHVTWVKF